VPVKAKNRSKYKKTRTPRNFCHKQTKGYFWSQEENLRYRAFLIDNVELLT
jgi:hypothetical protein